MRVMMPAWGSGLVVLSVALLAAGCKGESITERDPDAVFGTAVIDVRTYGVNIDSDGYTVDVRGLETHNVPAAGQVDLRVTAGPARITLGGVADNCHIVGDPQRTVTIDVNAAVNMEYVVTCGSGQEHLAFASIRDAPGDIYVIKDGATTPVQVTNSLWHDSDPVWSPSGNRLAYATLSPDSTTGMIEIVTIDGAKLTSIGTAGTFSGYPSWAPADDRLAFSGRLDANTDIFVLSADGSTVDQLTDTPENELRPAWSPDGTRLVYDVEVPDTSISRDLFIMNADGTGARQLPSGGRYNFHAAWSPDGKWLAFVSQRDGNDEVYAINVEEGTLIRITSHAAVDGSPTWTADGKSIIFESRRSGASNLYKRGLFGGQTIPITNDAFHDIDPAVSR